MTRLRSFAALLVLSSIIGCSSKPAENPEGSKIVAPLTHRVDEVYFVLANNSGGLVAYVPSHSVRVVVIFKSAVDKPYVEVPLISETPVSWPFTEGKQVVAWGFGGILYLKDHEQLKELWLNRPE